jgi:hypothetical protein
MVIEGKRAVKKTEGLEGLRAEVETEGSREDRGLLRKQRVIKKIEGRRG